MSNRSIELAINIPVFIVRILRCGVEQKKSCYNFSISNVGGVPKHSSLWFQRFLNKLSFFQFTYVQNLLLEKMTFYPFFMECSLKEKNKVFSRQLKNLSFGIGGLIFSRGHSKFLVVGDDELAYQTNIMNLQCCGWRKWWEEILIVINWHLKSFIIV